MPPPAEGLASRLFLGPALRAQPDRRLVTLVREGYEAAFEEIVRRYARPLGRYAASIVGGRSEDVLQDAFAKALPALRRDDAEIDLRPWLFRIVRNAALNDLRDSPPSTELLAEALAGGRNPADELEQREQLADLMRRLRALPEPQRAAIVMRELEGLGHEEIAAALGLTGGGARQAIYRARRALRDGAGLLLPLPLLRLLIDHGGEAAGAGAGGAIAAGASAGGAGGAIKLGVVAAVVAGSVGAGVAVQSHREGDKAHARAAPVASQSAAPGPAASDAALSLPPSVATAAVSAGRHPAGSKPHGAGPSSGQVPSGDPHPAAVGGGGRIGHPRGRHSPPPQSRGHHGELRGGPGKGLGSHRGGPRTDGHGDSSGPHRGGDGQGDREGEEHHGGRSGEGAHSEGASSGNLQASDESGHGDESHGGGESSSRPAPPPPPEEHESDSPGENLEKGGENEAARDLGS
jgi:RNA polymerase sigma factor (sigma-70 family)